jgi:hypothetical protein
MNNPLTESHVALSINIFDQTQHALVRKHLTIERLIGDILREFAQELDLNRKYILIYDGRQLDPALVIGDENFDSERELIFAYYEPVRSGTTMNPSPSEFVLNSTRLPEPDMAKGAVLREVETGQEFWLRKNPTIIGRSNPGSGVDNTIDIDLLPLREGRTVSRPHAKISWLDGVYFFEGLKEQRPVFVNDMLLPSGKKHPLSPGDRIGVGKVQLKFELN